ncbi:hypothetical protein HYPSUDRAFT_203734 [Hypholoma sublateritium FD-334 SS-4]|uniref:F-box domain-containing protein n=1 Tax=Hypholoma sublateritium (strain FD-334 SS-4) TaxID=945553 RepID=A0A0D2MAL5_HYPSF|nr:hypothetical protein HYPSUDRAFT_203734 [Hypholoma sublateritium FD-334 SS-4]
MKSGTTSGLPDAIYSSFQSAFRSLLGQKTAGPPKLTPELEQQIFETCALDCPEVCSDLVLVSKMVYKWIDPILLATVCITEEFHSQRQGKMKSFLAKLTSGKMPLEYYAQHVKNLGIFGGHYEEGEIDRVLAICTGVENLVINKMVILNKSVKSLAFFDNPQAGTALRRLYVNLWWNTSDASAMPTFDTVRFRSLTHLHLADDDENWPFYTGWETLVSLTHLAFACCSPELLAPVMQVLPVIRYVALGHYRGGEQYRYADVVVNNSPYIRAAWGVRVVFLSEIPRADWERGARGGGDFWDVVEEEVERRLQDGSG